MTQPQATEIPSPSPHSEPIRFSSNDGTQLYGEWFSVAAPRAAAVILHGYSEHGGRYQEVIALLAKHKIAVLTFDLRGHGKADGPRGYVGDFSQYIEDLEAAISQLRSRSTAPLFIIAHSNGALIALRYLCDPRIPKAPARAAIFSAPFLELEIPVPRATRVFAKIASKLIPSLTVPTKLRVDLLTQDPAQQNRRRTDALCHEVVSAQWFDAAIRAQKYVHTMIHHLSLPTLWLVPDADQIAKPQTSIALCQRIPAPTQLRVLSGMRHEVFHELDRALAFTHVSTFIDEHLLPCPASQPPPNRVPIAQ